MSFCEGLDGDRKTMMVKIAESIGKIDKEEIREIMKRVYYRTLLVEWEDYDHTKEN